MRSATWLWMFSLMGGGACTTADVPMPFDDVGVVPVEEDAGLSVDAWRREAGPLPDTRIASGDIDGNTRIEEAAPIAIGDEGSGSLDGAADVDYFSFDAAAGTFIAIVATGGGVFDRPSLALLDPDGRFLVAPSDSLGCAGPSDVEMVTRLPVAGRYFIEVATGYSMQAVDSYAVRAIDLATVPTTLVVREGATPTISPAHVCVVGAFESEGDVDLVGVGLPSFALLQSYDRARLGSTGAPSQIELLSAGRVLARVAPRDGFGAGYDGTPLTQLRVEGPAVEGANDHYLIRPLPLSYYGPGVTYVESQEEANDARTTPEPVALGPRDDGGYLPWFAGYLPEGDVDHFSFSTESPGPVQVSCRSASLGSAIRGLEVRLIEPDGRPVGLGLESSRGYEVTAEATLEPGTHLVQVRAGAPDPTIDGALFACSISY